MIGNFCLLNAFHAANAVYLGKHYFLVSLQTFVLLLAMAYSLLFSVVNVQNSIKSD